MLQLAYLSSSTVEVPDLSGIIERSSARNATDEITGVLLYRAGHYLQVLEGPKELVQKTFLRIIIDERHKKLYLLSRQLITSRQFGTWSMMATPIISEQRVVIDQVRALMIDVPAQVVALFEMNFGRVD